MNSSINLLLVNAQMAPVPWPFQCETETKRKILHNLVADSMLWLEEANL